MNRKLLFIFTFSFIFSLLPSTANPFSSRREGYPNYAAFSDMKWNAGKPSVLIDNTWGEFISIHGVPTKDIVAWCKKNLGDKAQERFREDLPVVLQLMGHKVPIKTKLVIRVDGQAITKEVTMTEEKRRQLHGKPLIKQMAISQEQKIALFEDILLNRFSYLNANKYVWQDRLTELKKKKELSNDELVMEFKRIMSGFIDGHASVSGFRQIPAKTAGKLPVLIESTQGKFVAFSPERKTLLNPKFPYLTKIDDIPMDKWLEACAPFIQKGSPQYITRDALRQIRHLNFYRQRLKLPLLPKVRLTLANQDGDQTLVAELPVSEGVPSYGRWPRARTEDSHILDNNIGYLRISSMDEQAEKTIAKWMPKFSNTAGLIIDVRNNGGGSRRALLELASWLIEENDPPHVANVGKYRLWEGFEKKHLEARFMARSGDPRWSLPEKKAITAFAKSFKPEWQPEPSKFSEWHYLLLSHPKEKRPYTYRKPIVILQDAKCFSATDIFLGALKGWKPNITLMGTPSGGGSARSIRHAISKEINIRCASMASFQPNGKLYDGNGITPDIIVHPTPSSFLHGSEDNQLNAAIKLIQSK